MRFNLQIPSAWHYMQEVRTLVEKALEGVDRELRDACVMTASELAENAIKYGQPLPSLPQAEFCLSIEPNQIVVSMASASLDEAAIKRFTTTVDRIRAAEDKGKLYLERLQEMMENPADSGRFGLLRIAFEGKFELNYTYQKPVLTVISRRGTK